MNIRFGPFDLDLAGRQLRRDGQRVPLPPKVYQLLCILAEERPRALSRQELQSRLWPNTFVSDVNLACLVAELRTALGDWRRLLRTIHGFGYALDLPDPAAGARPTNLALVVLVLPIVALAVEPPAVAAAAELTDELITRLGAAPGVSVLPLMVARTVARDSLELPKLALERHVSFVVEGSVRPDPAGLRVNARLFDAQSGMSVWSERLLAAPRQMADLHATLAGALLDAMRSARRRPEVVLASSLAGAGGGPADEDLDSGHA